MTRTNTDMRVRMAAYRTWLVAAARRGSFLAIIVAIFVLMVLAVIVRELFMLVTSGSPPPQASPVVTAEVTPMVFADTITAVGTARANESVAVTSKISDTISRVMFESGDRVAAGQVLAELVDAEEAAGLNAARATLEETRRERVRVGALAQRGVAPAQRRDEAESAYQRAVAQVSAIEARMADRIIRAPFAGEVGLRNISAGELISTGTVIATLNDVTVIKLDFAVPERFVSSVRAGQLVNARVTAWPDDVFTGLVTNIDNQIDPVSRTVTVRAEIPNDDGRLVPGMLMRVEVRRDERMQTGIPEAALMRLADQSYVFVAGENDDGHTTARRRDVETGLRSFGYVEILSGLEDGERVIVDGTHRTRDGGAVRVTSERPAPPERLRTLTPSPELPERQRAVSLPEAGADEEAAVPDDEAQESFVLPSSRLGTAAQEERGAGEAESDAGEAADDPEADTDAGQEAESAPAPDSVGDTAPLDAAADGEAGR